MIVESNVVYKFAKSYHISYNQDYFCCVGTNVILYDFKTGELVRKFGNVKQPFYSKFMLNGQLIVKTTSGKYFLYDLERMVLLKKILPPPSVKSSTTKFQVTSDNKYIIDFSFVFPTYQLMIVEIETGEYSFIDLGYARKGFVFPTNFESNYYLIANCAKMLDSEDVSSQVFYKLSYDSGNFALQKLFVDNYGKLSVADYGSNKFVVANYSNVIKIFDLSGNYLDNFEYSSDGILYDLKISKNGQFVALIESKKIYIYDTLSKNCIKCYDVEYGCFVDFLDEDKLLIGTWKKGYCVSLKNA